MHIGRGLVGAALGMGIGISSDQITLGYVLAVAFGLAMTLAPYDADGWSGSGWDDCDGGDGGGD